MYSRFQRYPWFTVFTALTFVGLIALSCWQVQRLAWKQQLIARIEAEEARPAQTLASPNAFPGLPEFRRVKLKGKFLTQPELHIQGRYYQGNTGIHLVYPFQLTQGPIILVNRGWVPKDYKKDPRVKFTLPKGPQTITGIIRRTEAQRFQSILPQNNPEQNFWIWQNVEEMQEFTQTKLKAKVLPVLLQQTREANQNDFPIALESRVDIRNDHLQYAITWAALAAIVAVMYLIYTDPKRNA